MAHMAKPSDTSPSPCPSSDVRDLLDQALATPRGLRVSFPTPEAANAIRMRIYALRKHDSSESRKIYPPDHPTYNRTPYDSLIVRVVGSADGASLVIEPAPAIPPATPL
jgi:hypothetical protein